MKHIRKFKINEERNYTIEDLLAKYEKQLSSLEEHEQKYDDLVGLSDEDYYSAGQANGEMTVLREIVEDIQKNFL